MAIPRVIRIALRIVLLIWLTLVLTAAWLVISAMRPARQTGGLAAVSAGISEAFVETFLILTAILITWAAWHLMRRYRTRGARLR